MAPAFSASDSGILDGEDGLKRAERLAARAARFSKNAPGKRIKELEEARSKERKAFEEQGLITLGKTELDAAVDMRGTCERMCSAFEAENRDIRGEVHPFERGPNMKMDLDKAVAAYTRSDAGAGHGESAILPSDLRTPATLARTLDYLFSEVMAIPPSNSGSRSIARKALGYSAGFIRDRTRAIRKEFAMQSTWGHAEAIASFERIARWHILCLRELQEETGTNSDMHIDSAELGRCFTSLRQQYNDRREETGLEMPCPNEPEFRAYMLIFDLANKSVSIPTAELPAVILDHPLVKLAWEIRKVAQRNFDTQKEGSKLNSELGANLVTKFIKLLRRSKMPFLLSCLLEVRLRDMRRSALRAMTRTYPRLRADPIRVNELGQIVERRMVLLGTLDAILGCEEQEDEESAFDDVEPTSKNPDDEAVSVVSRFEIEVFPDHAEPVGAMIHAGAAFNDNRDAPYTRRWKLVTERRNGLAFVDIVNGAAGIHIDGKAATRAPVAYRDRSVLPQVKPAVTVIDFAKPQVQPASVVAGAGKSAFNFTVKPPTNGLLEPHAAPPRQAEPPSFFGTRATASPSSSIQVAQPSPIPPSAPPKFTFGIAQPAPAPQTTTVKPSPDPVIIAPPPVSPQSSFFSMPTSTSTLPPKPNTQSVSPLSPPPQSTPQPFVAVSAAKTSVPSAPSQLSANEILERHRYETVLPKIRDLLLKEVAEELLLQIEPDLARIVKQREAALLHSRKKTARQKLVVQWAEETYQSMLDSVIHDIGRETLLMEVGRRTRLRRSLYHWRRWARRQREEREEAARERQGMLDRLSGMSLSHSTVAWNDGYPTPITDGGFLNTDRPMDEFEVDVSLQQAERSKDHFFSPATFLDTTARHVAPLLSPSCRSRSPSSDESDSAASVFQVIISTAQDSATPTSQEGHNWLLSKFMPAGDEEYVQDDVIFQTEVLKRNDDLPSSDYAGLFIMEAPGTTWDSGKQRQNVADVHDRLRQLRTIASMDSSRYSPVLLIVTWEDETFDEVVERLEIVLELKAFQNVALLSLESFDDLDARYADVLAGLLPEVVQKEQVVITCSGIVKGLTPALTNLFETIGYLVNSNPTSPSVAMASFDSAIRAVSKFSTVVSTAIGKTAISRTSTFEPLPLPPFEVGEARTISSAADAIIAYLSSETLCGVSEIALLATPLHQAVLFKRPLPLVEALQAITLLVWGEAAGQTLALEVFKDDTSPYISDVLDRMIEGFSTFVGEQITRITQISSPLVSTTRTAQDLDQDPFLATLPPPPVSTDTPKTIQSEVSHKRSSPASKGIKRSRSGFDFDVDGDHSHEVPADENTPITPGSQNRGASAKKRGNERESKAAKNARLSRLLKEVEMTLDRGLAADRLEIGY